MKGLSLFIILKSDIKIIISFPAVISSRGTSEQIQFYQSIRTHSGLFWTLYKKSQKYSEM
jgi:hypothetical protein